MGPHAGHLRQSFSAFEPAVWAIRQRRIAGMRNLVLFLSTLCGVSLVAQTPAPDAQKQTETPKSVHQLFLEDQQDLPSVANGYAPRITEEEYSVRSERRRTQLRAMIAAAELKSGDDFKDAAYLFQHGESAEDYLFAHVLAMEAIIKGNDSAKWIAAATLDRYLQLAKQPQVFGTQYETDPNAQHPPQDPHAAAFPIRTQAPYNEQMLPDAIRLDFCVPVLAQQKQNLASFNSGKRPSTMVAPGCTRKEDTRPKKNRLSMRQHG
jgi:hypothetical protein